MAPLFDFGDQLFNYERELFRLRWPIFNEEEPAPGSFIWIVDDAHEHDDALTVIVGGHEPLRDLGRRCLHSHVDR